MDGVALKHAHDKHGRLPDSVQEVADVIGREKALLLVSAAPRCYPPSRGANACEQLTLYVPSRLKPTHRLVSILGWNDATKLARYFGGEILRLANCRELYRPYRDSAIRLAARDNVPHSLIAQWFAVSIRLVRDVVEGHEEGAKAHD